MKKNPGDIIILHMCTKNYDQMMYSSWDMVHNRQMDGQKKWHIEVGAPPKNLFWHFRNWKKEQKHSVIRVFFQKISAESSENISPESILNQNKELILKLNGLLRKYELLKQNMNFLKVACRVQVAYLKGYNHHFFTVFLNKFLKHVFNSILKFNNHLWKKV